MQPVRERQKRSLHDRLNRALGPRSAKSLYDEVVRGRRLRPTLTLSSILAFVLASAVHGLTLSFVILAAVVLVGGGLSVLSVVAAAVCLGIAWLLRPRLPRLSEDDRVLSREQLPATFGLLDDIAASLKTRRIDGVVLDARFNAAFTQIGWRRRRIVFIGLPLLAVLEPQERVALLGHEVAHGANGDPRRTFLAGAAIDSLVTWYELLYPDELAPPEEGVVGLAALPANLMLLALAKLAYGTAYLVALLSWRESQRAEYLADHLAATVAGTPATIALFEKLHLTSTYERAVQGLAVNPDKDFVAEFQQRVAVVPDRERERMRRLARLEGARLDATHPPTPDRVGALRQHPPSIQLVTLSHSRSQQIDAELQSFRAAAQQRLADEATDTLYA